MFVTLSNLRQMLNENLLRLVWRQWAQLGLYADSEFSDSWIIDPEALILITMSVGRMDPRLFDEVINWTIENGRWISLQRLKNIAKTTSEESRRALAAFAAIVDSQDSKLRWKTIADMAIVDYGGTAASFFTDTKGKPIPVIGEPDETFLERGFAREGLQLGATSPAAPMSPPTNLILKLRSLFGIAPRAEVIAYLLTHQSGRASAIARACVYSHPPILEALNELAHSGLLFSHQRTLYSADVALWTAFLQMESPPDWVDWPRVFRALSRLAAFLAETEKDSMSDYLLRSRVVTLVELLRDELADAGIANPFLAPCSTNSAIERLVEGTEHLAVSLNRYQG